MKKFLINALAVILSILITLIVGEVIYRGFVYKSLLIDPKITTSHHKSFCKYDSSLGWKHKKNVSYKFVTPEYTASLTFNSKGLRGPDISYEKSDDVYRVMILGDSYTEGYTVDLEDSFPEILRNELSKKVRNKKVQVINSGVGGYSTDQEYLYMKEEGRKYKPDLTVLMFCENDVYFNTQPMYWRGCKPYFMFGDGKLILKNTPVPKPFGQSQPKSSGLALPRSYLLSYLIERYEYMVMARIKDPTPTTKIGVIKYDQDIDNSWLITEAIIKELKLLLDSENCGLVVSYIPKVELIHGDLSRSAMGNEIDLDKPRNILSYICSKNQIAFIDLTEGLRANKGTGRLYYKKDEHWNKNGHKLVGQILARYIGATLQGINE